MYKTRLEQLVADVEGWMHTLKLKERLLSVLPDFQAHSQGKCIILTFDEDIGSVLRKACNIDDDSMHLARTAQVVCKEMFDLMDPLSLFLYASDAVRKGYKKLSVRTVDTDVVIPALLTWILEFLLLSQCFMHLQDAILSQHFVAEARRQLG